MGREKERMEAGYCSKPGLFVCTSCFENYAIKEFIEFEDASVQCSYCSGTNAVACSLDSVVSHIVESIHFEWDDPANAGVGWESAEGGWLGANIVYTNELLSDELELGIENDKLLADISDSILNIEWCKKSPYSLSEDLRLMYGWENFSNFAKYNSRYVLFKPCKKNRDIYLGDEMKPEEIMKSIGKFINHHSLTKEISTTVDIYRVRIVNENISFSSAKELGSPPIEYCTLANRMSPAGISMFYGAFDADTAIKETYEPEKEITKKAISGIFNSTRALTVIDLSMIPSVPSLFDEENRYARDSLSFLNDFIIDFCKPIEREDRAHVDYVPTQIVTEYFRHILKLEYTDKKVDGVIYPSSKNKSKKCVVIFANSKECDISDGLDIHEQILKLNSVNEIQLTRPINQTG